ncbi:MAG: ABC transporter ATP-binding protein [Clostridia bacterium]|nr:ABC transporter ATP-binding protein [Clostridia bacterium]
MNTLDIRNMTVGYGRNTVWQDFSLQMHAGEIIVLLGRNGCGKTTLLKALQGNIPLRSGSIHINGIDLASLSVRRRASLVTTMPQEIPVEAGLLGIDYLEMGYYPVRGPFGSLTAGDREKIAELADIFGTASLLAKDLSEMSAGERQMLSLMRTAVQDTPVLLLDEPASALDFNRTARLFSMLKTLAARGKCILAVLHDPTAALRVGSRVLCLGDGICLADLEPAKTPPDVLEHTLQKLYPTLRLHTDPLFCWSV